MSRSRRGPWSRSVLRRRVLPAPELVWELPELEVMAVGDQEVAAPVEAPGFEDPDDLAVHRGLGSIGILRRVDIDRGAVGMERGRRRRAPRDRAGSPASRVHLDLR